MRLGRSLLAILMVVVLLVPRSVYADAAKELFMSSAYGVLAGTLVGAASLAFTDQPGSNLKNIARGASLGLYAGILLGLYVVYVVPSDGGDDDGSADDGLPKPGASRSMVVPIISDKGVEGAALVVRAYSW